MDHSGGEVKKEEKQKRQKRNKDLQSGQKVCDDARCVKTKSSKDTELGHQKSTRHKPEGKVTMRVRMYTFEGGIWRDLMGFVGLSVCGGWAELEWDMDENMKLYQRDGNLPEPDAEAVTAVSNGSRPTIGRDFVLRMQRGCRRQLSPRNTPRSWMKLHDAHGDAEDARVAVDEILSQLTTLLQKKNTTSVRSFSARLLPPGSRSGLCFNRVWGRCALRW